MPVKPDNNNNKSNEILSPLCSNPPPLNFKLNAKALCHPHPLLSPRFDCCVLRLCASFPPTTLPLSIANIIESQHHYQTLPLTTSVEFIVHRHHRTSHHQMAPTIKCNHRQQSHLQCNCFDTASPCHRCLLHHSNATPDSDHCWWLAVYHLKGVGLDSSRTRRPHHRPRSSDTMYPRFLTSRETTTITSSVSRANRDVGNERSLCPS